MRWNDSDVEVETLDNLLHDLYGPNPTAIAIEDEREGTYSYDPSYFPDWWLRFK